VHFFFILNLSCRSPRNYTKPTKNNLKRTQKLLSKSSQIFYKFFLNRNSSVLCKKNPHFPSLISVSLFREIFAKIQQFVNLKFGKDNNSPLVLDFIFFKFICPAIIHPKRYELVPEEDELSTQSLRSLINVSKILNNLAHNIDEKFESKEFEKLKTFINKNHSILIEKLTQLVVKPNNHLISFSGSNRH
jgi:hypothetical protein